MKNAVIVHGWGADSQSNWFPWIKKELEKQGYFVTVPDFPNSQNPLLTEWLAHFEKETTINQDTILIGHSLGAPFILRFLEQFSLSSDSGAGLGVSQNDGGATRAAFLVAAFDKSLRIPEIENFVDKPFDWQKIKSACKKFFVINSDNDPYIPIQIGKDLAKNLGTKLIIENNGEHLSNPDDMFGYPKLLNLILHS